MNRVPSYITKSIYSIVSEAFNVETRLKQGEVLSPLLFNKGLEKAVQVLQNEARGISVDEYCIKVLDFSDDLNILEESLDDTMRATKALERAAERIGLHINAEKTKLMKLLNSEMSLDILEMLPYEKVEEFQYLGVLLSTKNGWSRQIGIRITKAERAFFDLLKFLNLNVFQFRFNSIYLKFNFNFNLLNVNNKADTNIWL